MPKPLKPPRTFAAVLEHTAKAVVADLRKVGIGVTLRRPDRRQLLWTVTLRLRDDDDLAAVSWPVRLEHVRSVFLRELGHRFYAHFVVTAH